MFFGYVDEVDSHNKSSQSYLALETFWVTQCGWLLLFTTVAMGITITNFWKLFLNGVKRDDYDKLISIRECLERLGLDCFKNPFSTDTGNPENNIPPLDEVNEVDIAFTFRALHVSIFDSHSIEVGNISYITINSTS